MTPEMKPERIPTPFFDGVRIDDLSGKIQPMVTVDDYNLLAERCRRAEATRPTPQPSSEYVKAVDILETVKRCAALDQEDRMIIFSPESELMSEIDLALSALKSLSAERPE